MAKFSVSWLFIAALSLLALLAMHSLFWRRYAEPRIRYARPRNRKAIALGGFIMLLFACFPALFVAEALATGEVSCLSRLCGHVIFSVATDPVAYWTRVTILYAMCLFFFSGVLFSASSVLASRQV